MNKLTYLFFLTITFVVCHFLLSLEMTEVAIAMVSVVSFIFFVKQFNKGIKAIGSLAVFALLFLSLTAIYQNWPSLASSFYL